MSNWGAQPRLRGKVAWFNVDKGFGFIERDDGQADLYFHTKALMPGRGQVGRGDVVEFVIEQHKGRLRARDVDLIEPAPQRDVWVHPGGEAAQ
jgi:CspA family cold shock protein